MAFIQYLYTQVDGFNGYRQCQKESLKKVNTKHIYRLMQIYTLEAVILRRPKYYCKVKPDYVAENILASEFTTEKPN